MFVIVSKVVKWADFTHVQYLSVLLRGLDHMHVHVIDQIGHLWHVLDDLVLLSRCVSLKEGKQKKWWFWIQDVMWKKCRRIIVFVLKAAMEKYWSDTNVQGNVQVWPILASYLKANFFDTAFSNHCSRTIKRSRGCRVCNLIILVCRQSLTA